MHHLQPQRLRHQPVARAMVMAVLLLFVAGCSLVDQQVDSPASSSPTPPPAPSAASPSASASSPPIASSPAPTASSGTTRSSNDQTARDDGDGATSGRGDTDGETAGGGNDDARNDDSTADRGGNSSGSGNGSSDDDRQVADRALTRGDSGAAVRRLQQRLEELRYWVGPTDGVFGQLTEQAVFAFQGVEGITIDGVVGPNTRARLADAEPPQPRSNRGDLIEVDEQARVVLDVRGGQVRWAWHTSTGTNERYQHPAGYTALAETPNGRQAIDWQVDGVREGELGPLWRPKYFNVDGIAIHGYSSVPATPSSHGCVRVTKSAMDFIWANDIAPKGSTVWVYGRTP